MVKKNKTRKNKKQKGGVYSKENYEKIMKKADILVRNMEIMKNKPLEALDENNGIYKEFKKTILKPGTLLSFRSKFLVTEIQDRPMWLDYSPLIKKQSFLTKPENPANLPEEIPYLMGQKFGSYINVMRVIKPITILHFPVDYESKEKSQSPDSYSAFFEGVVRQACARKAYNAELFTEPCADGYTLDFFFKNMKGKFKGKGWYAGYREICIYHPAEFLEIYDHIFKPIEKPAE